MAQKIVVDVKGDGKLHVDYDGFVGNACFDEAEKLKGALAAYGLEVDLVKVIETKNEVEVRRLENTQRVGSGG